MPYQHNLSSFSGVDPTGTTDSTTGINNAIASLTGGGDILVDGIYLVDSGGVTLKSGVNLIGNGSGASVFKAMSQSFTTGILNGSGLNRFRISGIKFDWTNASNSGTPAIINLANCSYFYIEDNEFDGQFVFAIGLNEVSNFYIRKNRIFLTTAESSQNEGIVISCASGQSYNGWIEENILSNTGMDLQCTDTVISRNNINAWKFGAGITTEQSLCANLVITDNIITNGSGTDVNGTVCLGIENWAPRSSIRGNQIFGCAGDGIDNGGACCVISGNVVFNNGVVNGSGIASRYTSSTINGDYSVIEANQSFDTNGASGTQKYGYIDQNSSVYGITLVGNSFVPFKTGATNILGSHFINANNQVS